MRKRLVYYSFYFTKSQSSKVFAASRALAGSAS